MDCLCIPSYDKLVERKLEIKRSLQIVQMIIFSPCLSGILSRVVSYLILQIRNSPVKFIHSPIKPFLNTIAVLFLYTIHNNY